MECTTGAKTNLSLDKDKNGDDLGEYINKGEDNYTDRCNSYKKSFQIDNQGKWQIIQHAASSGHHSTAYVLKKRKKGQSMFISSSSHEPNNNPASTKQIVTKSFVLPTLPSPVTLPGSNLSLPRQNMEELNRPVWNHFEEASEQET